ncbi:MAG: DNA ligase D, partial [Gemmatimonadota bacterium]
LPGARRVRLPATWSPQLATRVDDPPAGDAWLHEIKFDGYRALCRIENGRARFLTRRGLDWTARFAPLDAAAAGLPVTTAAIDGEVVVQRAAGATSFQDLQEALSAGRGKDLVYYAFDLLHLDGRDLARVPLLQRKAALAQLLQARSTPAALRYSDHVVGSGAQVFREACRHQLEGIISKRKDSPVMAGRGRDWVKVKCVQRQEFVVGGFTEPTGSRTGFGALLVGLPEGKSGRLRYSGRVGTGFSDATLTQLRRRLGKLERATSPFTETLPRADARGARWVAPELVAEVEFTEWTRDGRLRHPSFQGLREDILPQFIVREVAEPAPAATPAQKGKPNVKPKSDAKPKATAKSKARSRTKRQPKAKATPPAAGEERIAGVRLTNPGRVLYPGQDVTKRTLAQFYVAIEEWIVPQLAGRPLTLVRCPRGAGGQCFYQKHADEAFPASVRRVEVPEDDGDIALYVAVDSIQGVVALVQLGVLEFHTWGSRVRTLEKPDRIIFDLDPDPAVAWPDVIAGARELRTRLTAVGLECFVKTTGGKGLHVEVPLKPRADWTAVKGFAHGVALALARDEPARYLATASKAKRKGKIYVDYLRNGRGATAIAAYSTRSRAGAPVATPLRWDELSPKRHPDHYTVATLPRRLATLREDPWAAYEKARATLPRGAARA